MSALRGAWSADPLGLPDSTTPDPDREPETGDRITLDSGRVVTLAVDWSIAWHEWLAIDDQTYDYDPDPVGTGETRQAAVDDLLEQIGDPK
jgi:hypothetical protein